MLILNPITHYISSIKAEVKRDECDERLYILPKNGQVWNN